MFHLVFILSISSLSIVYGQVCRPQYVGAKGKIFFLSQEVTSAVGAEQSCRDRGSQLAHVTDQNSYNQLLASAKQLYAEGLITVWMYEKNKFFQYSAMKLQTPSGWTPVLYNNKPFYFHLSGVKDAGDSELVAVNFCTTNQRLKWLIRVKSDCISANGWRKDFTLYTPSTFLPGTKRLYLYTNTRNFGTKATFLEKNSTDYKLLNLRLYAYDINLLLGSSPTPPSGQTQCSPSVLHLGENWERVCNKDVNDTTYFACQYQLTASASYNCQGLNVRWDGNLNKIPNTRNGDGIMVEISVLGTSLTRSVPYNVKSMTFTNISNYTDHMIKLTAKLSDCTDVNTSTTTQVARLPKRSTLREAYVISEQTVNVTNSDCIMTLSGAVSPQAGFCKLEVDVQGNKSYQFDVIQSQISFNFQLKDIDPGSSLNLRVLAYGTFLSVPQHRATVACSNPTTEAATSDSKGALVGALVAVVILLIIIVLVVLLYYKKRKNKNFPKLSKFRSKASNNRTSEIFRTHSNPQETTINIIEIPPTHKQQQSQQQQTKRESYKTTQAKFDNVVIKGNQLLKCYCDNATDEFVNLKLQYTEICRSSKESGRSHEVAHLPHNKKKNRYKDIYPYDDSRVILSGDENSDYINASYIQGYRNPRKFIASQGPKPEMVEDFWRMIWENQTTVVVMLTNLVESGKSKCAKYWPDKGQILTFGKFEVESLDEVGVGGIVRRDLIITDGINQSHVFQLQYTSWPDHDIPIMTSTMMYLHRMVEEFDTGKSIVVHCSAGAGRTGTYIALDVLVDELSATGQVNVMRATMKMRENRSDMIQNVKQYIFVHRLLVEHHFNPNSDRTLKEFKKVTANKWPSIIKGEFKRLEFLQELHIASNKSNQYDEDPNVVTVAHPITNNEVALNAFYVEDRSFPRHFITSENPDSDPEVFWTMVIQCNALTVFELEDSETGTKLASLFENDRIMFGDVSIDVMAVHYRDGFVLQELYVQLASGTSEPVVVTHICGLKWQENHNPPQPATLLSAIDVIDMFVSEEPIRRVKLLVHCRDGCTRSGMFIALMNCIDRLKSQQRIDIFRAVEDLRSINPNMANDREIYGYCYDVMLLYASIYDPKV